MTLLLALACAGGGPLEFDGKDDYAVVTGVDGLDGDALTVEAWVRRTQPSADRPDILARRDPAGHQDSFLFRVRGDMGGVLEYGIANDGREWGTSGRRPIPVDAWSFVAVTHDRVSGQIALYVDGVADGTWVAPFPPARSASMPMWLGGDPYRGPTGRPWAGQIGAVWVWGVVRSAAEIQSDRTTPPAEGAAGLLWGWTGEDRGHLQLGVGEGKDASDPVRARTVALPPR